MPVAFAFNVAEPDAFVRGASLAALRGVVARSGIDAIYTSERSSVERAGRAGDPGQRWTRARTGVEVLSFHLLYVHAPSEVHDAFRDVASAQEDKLRTINRANIFAVETVNQAKGEAAAMMEQALAFKEQQILHAQGRRRQLPAQAERLSQRTRVDADSACRSRRSKQTLPGLQKFVTPDARRDQGLRHVAAAAGRTDARSIAMERHSPIKLNAHHRRRARAAARGDCSSACAGAAAWALLASLFTVDVTEYGAGHPLRTAGARGDRARPSPQGAVRPRDRGWTGV